MEGWIKSYRAMLDNQIVCKDADHFAVWGYLLLNATHGEKPSYFAGKQIMLKPGQLITGRKKIADHFRIDENKVYRVLKLFADAQQIEQRPSNGSTLITIRNWDTYQAAGEHRIEQPLNSHRTTDEQPMSSERTTTEQRKNNDRTTDEQPMNTIQECKNVKNDNNAENEEKAHNTQHSQINFSSACAPARGDGEVAQANPLDKLAADMLRWVERNTPSVQLMEYPLTPSHAVSIVKKYAPEDIQRILTDMCNKGATKKNRSAFATFGNYARADFILKEKQQLRNNHDWNQQHREAISHGFVDRKPTHVQ